MGSKTLKKKKKKVGFTIIIVESAGNHGLNTSSKDPILEHYLNPMGLDSFVFVVNLDNGRNITEGSNTLEKSKKAQNELYVH